MPLRTVLCIPVRASPDGVDAVSDKALLKIAHRLLAREGHDDKLLIVGVGFSSNEALVTALARYRVEQADWMLANTSADDPDEGVGAVVAKWIQSEHPGAVPTVLNGSSFDWGYPNEDWWWTGVEASKQDGSMEYILRKFLPASFRPQAATWASIFDEVFDKSDAPEPDFENGLLVLALSLWLTGFDAACENCFFSFDYAQAAVDAELDLLRLGYEAASLGLEVEDLASVTHDELLEAATKACLRERTPTIQSTLSDAFGGDAQLFWSLHSSIWPDMKQRRDAVFEELLHLQSEEYSTLERPWRFVSDGWVDLADE